MSPTAVTAIVVNYNSGDFLLRCVESLLQERTIFQVQVVDNASTDDSLVKVEEEFRHEERVKVLYNKVNVGFARAINRSLRLVSSKFVLLVNPDCIVSPDVLPTIIAQFDDANVGVAGCLVLNPDGTEQRGCRRNLPNFKTAFFRAIGIRNWLGKKIDFDLTNDAVPSNPVHVEAISGAFMLVNMDAVKEVGFLDEGYFLHCEDLDWCRRFGEAGWKILFVPDAKVVHYQGTSSKGRPIRVLWHKHRGMWRYHRKFDAAKTSPILNALIYIGIHFRFCVLTSVELAKRLLGK